MNSKHYKKGVNLVENHRFKLLLLATLLVLLLPAFAVQGIISEILFIISMSFLFIQSMVVATTKKSKNVGLRYFLVVFMILLFWLQPFDIKTPELDIVRLMLLVLFFCFITFYLVKYMKNSGKVNMNVIMAAINIYLLVGIISGSLAFLFYKVIPGAYNIPDSISEPTFVTFNYYSFITMSTVGYGDITPRLPQTQTLAYFIAITGQLYVAIIIAFLVGKLLMHPGKEEHENS
jgi:voltage-gated potassium channel